MKTFKQFLEEQEIHAKKIEGALDWTPALSQGDYKVGDITFSARDGLGSVPDNASVNYKGFVALCKPSVFLRLAQDHAGERDGSAREIKALIEQGYAVGIPWLVVDTTDVETEEGIAKIKGHEGRARMLAIQQINGDTPIPIHCFLRGSTRAHHLTPENIRDLQTEIRTESGGSTIDRPFKAVYFNGKAV